MIWHILRKDTRLVWWLAAMAAAAQACAALVARIIDGGRQSLQLHLVGDMLAAVAVFSFAMAVVAVMQQDPVPGTRQDWLVRPIRRSDLVLAKLAAVLLLLQLPMWVVDVGVGLVHGFGLTAAMLSAGSRTLQMFCELALPAMLIGAVTRTVGEAVIMAVACLLLYMMLFVVGLSLLLGIKATIMDSGSHWMFTAAFDLAALLGTALLLRLQYSSRRTLLARWLLVGGGAAIVGIAFMPWPLAFSMQSALAPLPAAARPIDVTYNSHAGRFQLPLGALPVLSSALQLPLEFTGLPADSLVMMDRADVRISAPDGTLLYKGTSHVSVDGQGSILWARFWVRTGPGDGPVHALYQRIYLPPEVYAQLAHREVRLAVDYSLTLFGQATRDALPAVAGNKRLADLGQCRTSVDAEGDDVVLECWSATRPSSCATAYLEEPGTGARDFAAYLCMPDYSPALFGQVWPDAIYRTRGEVQ